MLSEIQTFVEWLVKTFGAFVGGLMVFLVPYWAWKKESKIYEGKKGQSKEDASKSATGQLGTGIAQAFVLDNMFTERIVNALHTVERTMEALCGELSKTRRQQGELEEANRELYKELKDLREASQGMADELIALRKSLMGDDDHGTIQGDSNQKPGKLGTTTK